MNKKTCDVCGRDFDEHGVCSTFCIEASQEDKDKFRLSRLSPSDPGALKPGYYGLFPCDRCGCYMEGDFEPGTRCGECDRIARTERRTDLLKRVLKEHGVSQGLLDEIRTELGT